MQLDTATISKKGLYWYKTGHPWIYRDDIVKMGPARSGDIVVVTDARDRRLGKALYGDRSKITLRFLTRGDEDINEAFWKSRVAAAVERRRGTFDPEKGAARLIYSEGDLLPGLIADLYARRLVIQALVPGIDSRLDMLSTLIADEVGAESIVARNDSQSRSLEGLTLEKRMIRGDRPGLIEVEEGDIRYLVDVWNGHKTGAYLDQKKNRRTVARHAVGRALDCFSYQGLFALEISKNTESVTAVESSKTAIEILEKNRTLNGADNISVVQGNAFDLLRLYHKNAERFDTIVLDPPPLARKKSHLEKALRGYKEINLRAMHLLNRGGVLASFSCSHCVPRDLFFEVLREAAADARSCFRVLDEMRQENDHPVLLSVPETAYLKGFILQKV